MEGRPRIPPVTEATAEQVELLEKTLKGQDGSPLNIFSTLAHHPALLKRYSVMGGLFMLKGRLSARDREVIILRVAIRAQCEYEFGQHTLIGAEAGLTPDEIRSVSNPGSARWSADDRALLALVDEAIDSYGVSVPTWAMVAAKRQADEMLEIVALIGFYLMTALVLNAVEVERDLGVPGWPPENETS